MTSQLEQIYTYILDGCKHDSKCWVNRQWTVKKSLWYWLKKKTLNEHIIHLIGPEHKRNPDHKTIFSNECRVTLPADDSSARAIEVKYKSRFGWRPVAIYTSFDFHKKYGGKWL